MRIEDIFDRKQVEVFTVKPEVKAMSNKERFALLNQLFKDEYQGKPITFEMLEKEFFVRTTSATRRHFGFRTTSASRKGHSTKINIGASGGYLDLISRPNYSHTEREKKENKNDFHKHTDKWHYFKKVIYCEGDYFQVMIDVQENKNHEFTVYNISLRELRGLSLLQENEEKEFVNSVPEGPDLRDELSSEDSIAQDEEIVNRKVEEILADANDRAGDGIGSIREQEIGFE